MPKKILFVHSLRVTGRIEVILPPSWESYYLTVFALDVVQQHAILPQTTSIHDKFISVGHSPGV